MKSRRIVRKKVETIQPNKKIHREKIQKYSYVEVHWLDIVGDAGWQSFDQLKESLLGRMVSRGWLYSTDKGVTRIFSDYGLKDKKEGDEGYIETVGGTTIIPNSVVTKIIRIK